MINNTDEQRKMEIEDMVNALKMLGNEATLEQKAKAMEDARKRRQAPISYLLGVLVVLLAGVGCGLPLTDTHSERWCETHRCDFVDFTFDQQAPEGHGGIEAALDSLNKASGLELAQDPMGIPVRWAPEVFDKDGKPVCGITEVTKSGNTGDILSIEITIASVWRKGCKPDWMTIRHEIACHALTGGEWHTESGMCSPWSSTTSVVDQESLDFMCSHIEGGCPLVP